MPKAISITEAFLLVSTYTVFISANHPSFTIKERRKAHERLISDITMQGHYYKELQGVYKGKPERSIMVRCDDVMDLLNLQALAHKYMQECIMIVDKQANRVLLNYSDDTTTIIGFELIQLSEGVAKEQDSYSIIDGDYWVVV